MANWFISINGEQKGPYPTEQLRQLVTDGFVSRDAYVWREGMAQWQPISQVRVSDDPVSPAPVAQPRDYSQNQAYQQPQAYANQSFNPINQDVASDYRRPGYFSFNGRISRKTYWLWYLVLQFVVQAVLASPIAYYAYLIKTSGDQIDYTPVMVGSGVYTIIVLIFAVAGLSAVVKRLHDRGRSGWFALLMFVPLANIWILIELLFIKGTAGPNEYGPDPLG